MVTTKELVSRTVTELAELGSEVTCLATNQRPILLIEFPQPSDEIYGHAELLGHAIGATVLNLESFFVVYRLIGFRRFLRRALTLIRPMRHFMQLNQGTRLKNMAAKRKSC